MSFDLTPSDRVKIDGRWWRVKPATDDQTEAWLNGYTDGCIETEHGLLVTICPVCDCEAGWHWVGCELRPINVGGGE